MQQPPAVRPVLGEPDLKHPGMKSCTAQAKESVPSTSPPSALARPGTPAFLASYAGRIIEPTVGPPSVRERMNETVSGRKRPVAVPSSLTVRRTYPQAPSEPTVVRMTAPGAACSTHAGARE